MEKKNLACRHEEITSKQPTPSVSDFLSDKESLLMKIIEELEDKNRLLQENSDLLKEKIKHLEEKVSELATPTSSTAAIVPGGSSPTPINSCIAQPPAIKNIRDQHLKNSANNVPQESHRTNITSKIEQQKPKKITSSQVKTAIENAQRNVEEQETADIWETQRNSRRRQQQKTKQLGTSEESSNGFLGVEKRLWIYLYRIQRSVNENKIMQFIKQKQGFENLEIQVQELPTDQTQNKCFLVTAPFDKKEELYNVNFWPRNVGVKRYNFNIQKNYKKQQTRDQGPTSF